LRCLIEAINRIDHEKQATPKRELVIAIQVGILNSSLMQALNKNEASQPYQDSALDH
jgi:hypothetical protein